MDSPKDRGPRRIRDPSALILPDRPLSTAHCPLSDSTPLGIQNDGPHAEDDTGPDGIPVPDPMAGKRLKGLSRAYGGGGTLSAV